MDVTNCFDLSNDQDFAKMMQRKRQQREFDMKNIKFSFEHNNVPAETSQKIAEAVQDNKPFALKSPSGVMKFFNPPTLQSWHHNATVKYDNIERLYNDISMSLYRFKEFVSFEQIKLLPDAPKQLQG